MTFYTRLALTAVALTGSLHLALAQAPAEQSRLYAASVPDQSPARMAQMMNGQPPGGMPMMDEKMGGEPSGGMPMMDDKMGGKPSGGMPMMGDKKGGMAAEGSASMAGPEAGMERMMSMMATAMSNMSMMGGRGGMAMRQYEHVEGRIAYLQAELAITDAQTTQWRAFADALRSAAKSMQAAVAAQPAGPPVSAPERGERAIQLLTVRLEAMRTVHAAGTALYAVLSDDQKKIVDELMAGPMNQM